MDQGTKELSSHVRPIPRHIAEADPYYQSSAGEWSGERNLKDYVQLLIKYRWLIVSMTAVVFLLTALYSFLATPLYTATATLKINTYAPLLPGAGIESVLMQQSKETDYLNTQIEVLSGLSLADRVLSEPSLGSRLDAYLERQTGLFSVFSPIFSLFQGKKEPEADVAKNDSYRHPITTLKQYLSLVSVEPIRKTSLVKISATTSAPELSAEIANAHSAAFINLIRAERQETTLENLVFLKGQAQELADKLSKSERDLAQYAEENAIVSLNKDENIIVKQMADLNTLLTAATARRIESESRFNEAASGSGVDTTAFDDESIQSQRIQLKEAEAEYALLSEKFKPGFPKMVQLKARIDALRDNLKQQRSEVVKGLEAKYKADLESEQELRERLEVQKSKAFELSRREVQYNIMRREYDSLKDLHQSVLRQLKEAQLSAESGGTNIAIADRAAVPINRSSPKRFKNMLLALLVGPLLGCGLALLAESLDNTLKTPEEAQRVLNVPALGIVPMFSIDDHAPELKRLDGGDGKRGPDSPPPEGSAPPNGASALVVLQSSELAASELVTLRSPRSIASVAFRSIRTSILLSSVDNPPRVIMVTSGQKSEGKTSLICNLAITLTQSGYRTVLVDCDLRRPALDRRFNIDRTEAGLVDCLAGQKSLADVRYQTDIGNLEVIVAGSIPPNPSELLGSNKMAALLDELREEFDYVLVDAPPLLPVTDAVVLSRTVDGVVLVVRGQETQTHVAKDAANKLRQVGANILGVVLNDIDIRSGDYYYYRRGYYAYYHAEDDNPRKRRRAFG
ncbi:MAG: polysaccharide biosynthesis tyrosine autokinase [Bdellovibrionales bacterium]|nr:polysaccharide biosynthesis tyrosine autokinase [Bdellovibrionales bacterium]